MVTGCRSCCCLCDIEGILSFSAENLINVVQVFNTTCRSLEAYPQNPVCVQRNAIVKGTGTDHTATSEATAGLTHTHTQKGWDFLYSLFLSPWHLPLQPRRINLDNICGMCFFGWVIRNAAEIQVVFWWTLAETVSSEGTLRPWGHTGAFLTNCVSVAQAKALRLYEL